MTNKYTEEVLNIFRTSEVQKRFWDKVDKSNPDGCWVWTATKSKKGYGQFTLNGFTHRSHILSLWSYLGKAPNGLFACHTCDNPSCVRPDHLWFGTQSENIKDAYAKGRLNSNLPTNRSGENSGSCKITEAQAIEIIKVRKEGTSRKLLHEMFPSISEQTISAIIYNGSWKHLPR